MSGAGPYVSYTPYRREEFLQHTGLTRHYSDQALETLYERAKPFLIDRKNVLVEYHGWTEVEPDNDTALWVILGRNIYGIGQVKLQLPKNVLSLTDAYDFERYNQVFSARRPDRSSRDYFIEGPDALADIFYILQVVVPGVLTLIREDKTDPGNEHHTIRILPRKAWLDANMAVVGHILWRPSACDDLLYAASETRRAYKSEWIRFEPSPYDLLKRPTAWDLPIHDERDYSVCDMYCGYCGRCNY